MTNERKTKAELLSELKRLRTRLKTLQKSGENRERTEQALRESEHRYRVIFENVEDVYYETTLDGTIREVSPSIERLSKGQYRREDLIGKSMSEFYSDPGQRRALLDAIQEQGSVTDYEITLKSRDGSEVSCAISSRVRCDAQGRPEKIVGSLRDITERKRAESALSESEETMRYIIKHDPNAIAVYDRDLHYIAVSDRYLSDYNVKEADVIGRHHYEVFPEMPEKWKEVHGRCLAGATERNDDDSFERPDGSITYNRWECRPWYRVDGTIGGMITYTEVTTERKKAEQALRESEEKFRTVFDSANVGKSITLPTGEINANKALCEMLGYSRDELKGKRWQDLTPAEEIEAISRALQPLISGEKDSARFNNHYIHKNGSAIWTDVSTTMVRDVSGRPLHFITTVIDVTRQKEAESELRESEAFIKAVMDNLPIGVAVNSVDPDVKFEYMNDNFLKFYRTSREALANPGAFWDVVYEDPEFRESIKQRVLADNASGDPARMQWVDVPITRSGEPTTYITASNTSIPHRSLVISSVWDVTERKRAEHELQASKLLLQIAGRMAQLGGWSVDLRNNRVLWSDEVAAIHEMPPGYSPRVEEGIDFYAPEWKERIKEVFGACVREGKPYDEEMEIITARGRRVWVRTKGEATRDESGKITRVQGAFQDITDRKQTEEALRASKEHYRKLADNFPNGTVTTYDRDLHLKFVAGNELSELGAYPETYLGKTFQELAPPETFAIAEPHLRAAFNGRESSYETPYWGDRHYLVSAAPLRSADGSINEIMVVSWNITESKRAAEALRQSEEKWKSLVHNSPDYIALHDREARYLFLNRYAEGFSEKDIRGKSAYDFVLPESREAYRAAFETCVRTMTKQHLEYHAPGNSAGASMYEGTFVPIVGSGKEINVLVVARDITTRKRAEESLKQALDWQEALFEGSRDAIFVSDENSRFVAVNDAASILTGYSREQLLTMTIPDLHDHPDLQAYSAFHRRIVEGEDLLTEARILRGDGVKVDTEFNNKRVFIAGKLYMHTSARDITGRKLAEKHLLATQQQLHLLAGHLQSVREEERKHLAQEFHDQLGQTLTAVKMDLSMLLRKSADVSNVLSRSVISLSVESMQIMVDKAIAIIREILSELRPELLDQLGIVPTLEWEAEKFQRHSGIPCSFSSAVEEITLDARKSIALYRIFQEAMTNVTRHAKATSVDVVLRRGNNELVLEIRDDGVGIPADAEHKAGSFGLIGMRERAIMLGGVLEIHGVEGKGTLVGVRVPLEETTSMEGAGL